VSEWRARELLQPAGVPFVPAALARSPDEAAAIAAKFACPVAVKLVSPDVPHKSDIGAVRLGVSAADHVRQAYQDVLAAGRTHREGLRAEGVLIAPMRDTGVELLVGVTRDPQWGLAIAVGLGGIFAEVVADVAVRLLPVTDDDIAEMLTELRGSAVLGGLRGEPAVDQTALVSAVASIAAAAWTIGDAVESLEVNPLLADHRRAEALDALIVFRDHDHDATDGAAP
jgi:acetate---CoA ligase (ADP-forming)